LLHKLFMWIRNPSFRLQPSKIASAPAPQTCCVPGLFIFASVTGQFIVHLKVFSKGELPVGLDFKSNVLYKSIASKSIQSDMNCFKMYFIAYGCSGCNGWGRVKRERTKSRERLLRTILFYSGHFATWTWKTRHGTKIYEQKAQRKGPDDDSSSYRNVCNVSFVSFSLAVIFIIRAQVNNSVKWDRGWWHKYTKQASLRSPR